MLARLDTRDLAFHSKSVRLGKGATEHYIAITASPELGFKAQLEDLQSRYLEAQRALGLKPETAIFRRIFLSDAVNQAALVRESALFREPEWSPAAVSIVQQPPLPGSKVALLAYHVVGEGTRKTLLSPKHLVVERNGLRHLWSTRMCAGAHTAPVSVGTQTWEVFGDLIGSLAGKGANLSEHCVRTWLYLKDVDVFYGGMVESRGKIFRQHGMTEKTHYIASTGIEGACEHQYDLVLMDAYSLLDMRPGQMSYLHDLDKLCPTKDYNVHFERGTKLAFGDRAHYFISGTASIDTAARVVHPGNVERQLDRALTNVDGLLASGGASLDDMTHLIVYLRDAADYERVRSSLFERLPQIPAIFVKAPVCRPEWLVEIEGIAATAHDAPELPSF